MSPHRIEVTQDAQPPADIAAGQITQNLLDHQLRSAVGIGGRERMIFRQRQPLRLAIYRRRGTEHEGPDPALVHGFEQAQGAEHIVVVVGQRVCHGLPDSLEACKMDDRFGFALLQGRGQGRRVADVAAHAAQALARDPFHSRQGFGVAVAEVVEYRDVETGRKQLDTGVGTDIAGTAGDQNGHQPLAVGRHSNYVGLPK